MSRKVIIGTVEQINVILTTSYMWKIKDFSKIDAQPGSSILSPLFTTADSSVKWRLKFYPKGKSIKTREYLALSVYYCSKIEVNASYEIAITNAENEILEHFIIRQDLKLAADFESQSGTWVAYRSYPNFVEKSFLEDSSNNVLADDCLTISFEVILQNPLLPIVSDNDVNNFKDDRLKEFNDFGNLLNSKRFSDVTFLVGDQQIHAHKAILAARNSIFKDMLEYSGKYKEQKIVLEIDDLEYEVVIELLRFLYVGKVEDVYSMADDLFAAADEYCVQGLKTFCEKTLCANLKIYNALELFSIADIRQATLLKERALEFIVDHAHEIVQRDEFASLRSGLMREIIRAMARKKLITENQ